MFRCTICRWDVELDDVEIRGINGGCICVRCYGRLVENERRMPKELRKELISVMAEVA
jgi:hypothetical protein